jgi:hypothetical protein
MVSKTWIDGKESNYFELLENKVIKSYEKSRVFQDMWVCWLSWVELVIGEDGLVC